MKQYITIRLTTDEANLLTDFIADATYLTPNWAHETKLSDLFKFGEAYKFGAKAGKTVDELWAKIAHKIGKTDSCRDCKSKKPVAFCPKRFK